MENSEVNNEIVAAAQAILGGKLGVTIGAQYLLRLFQTHFSKKAIDDPDWVVMMSVDSQTDHLPTGPEREHWDSQALAAKDEEMRKCDALFRDDVFRVCSRLIERYKSHP